MKAPAKAPYALLGPQVGPAAAFWLHGNTLPHVVPLDKVLDQFRDKDGEFKEDVFYPVDDATIKLELDELQLLAHNRDTPLLPNLPSKLKHLVPFSEFLNLQSPPFGAIFDTTGTQWAVNFVNDQEERIQREPTVINMGGELARMFELETPGLYHQHLLNWLLFKRTDISPPRHARVGMALNVALYSALSAAWWFKWAAPEGIAFRLRPYEYDRNQDFAVLYDKVVPDKGKDDYDNIGRSIQGTPRTCPCPSPGTPRHPAYPSGHSTYSAAASRILEYFFSPNTLALSDADLFKNEPTGPDRFKKTEYLAAQFRKLAHNIGESRIWGGIHWRSDHRFGQRVGHAVADTIIEQLRKDCVPVVNQDSCEVNKTEMPPTGAELGQMKVLRTGPCLQPNLHDFIPPFEGDHLKRPRFVGIT